MSRTNAETTVGYFDFSKGKFVLYGSKEDTKKRRAKTKVPRQKSPLTEFKEYARKVGTYTQIGQFAKVELKEKGTTVILDADYPEIATDILMAYVQTSDDDYLIEVAPGVLLDADFEEDADDILVLCGIVQAAAINA